MAAGAGVVPGAAAPGSVPVCVLLPFRPVLPIRPAAVLQPGPLFPRVLLLLPGLLLPGAPG